MSKEVSSRERVQARVKMTGREREEKWAEMRSEVKDGRNRMRSHWKDLGGVSHDRT